MRKIVPLLVCLLLALPVFGQTTLTGAGATFPYPIYSRWFSEYHKLHSDVEINYQSIGSGGGIRQVTAGTGDFGASDMPMTDKQLKEAKTKILNIPTVLGADVPAYNIPGVSGELKFTPEALAGIFLGKISKWNDKALTSVNPGVNLPDKEIIVVHRSDGSGTTFIWTDYLSKVSPDWKSKVGSNTAVEWPAGIGAKGNEGVANNTAQTKGAIGYVEYAYAKQNKLTYTKVVNKAGKAVAPSAESFEAAAANADWANSPGFYQILTDEPGAKSWPIASAAFILVHAAPEDPATAAEALKFFSWAYEKGGKMAEDLDYVP